MKRKIIYGLTSVALCIGIVLLSGIKEVKAITTPIVVTKYNLKGWEELAGTKPLTFVEDESAPLGAGVLEYTTNASNPHIRIAQYDIEAVNLKDFYGSYTSKRLYGVAHAAPSYRIEIDKDGDLTTKDDKMYAFYEPIYNIRPISSSNPDGVNYDEWNTWQINVDSIFWYADKNRPSEIPNISTYKPLTYLMDLLPNAKVTGVFISQGMTGDGWTSRVDNVTFMNTVYDFEVHKFEEKVIEVNQMDYKNWLFRDDSDKYEFVKDPSAPIGSGALDINTPENKNFVQLYYELPTYIDLVDFYGSYDSIRLDGDDHAAPSYWLGIDAKDGKGTYMWIAYEPAYNFKTSETNYNQWNTWKIDETAKWWFLGGPPTGSGLVQYKTTFNDILALYPNSQVEMIVINQGTGNTEWHTRLDKVTYLKTTFDFELLTSKPTAQIKVTKSANNSIVTITGIGKDKMVSLQKHEFKITKPDGTIVDYQVETSDSFVEFDLETVLGEPLKYGTYHIEYNVTNILGIKSDSITSEITLKQISLDKPNNTVKDKPKDTKKTQLPSVGYDNTFIIITGVMLTLGLVTNLYLWKRE